VRSHQKKNKENFFFWKKMPQNFFWSLNNFFMNQQRKKEVLVSNLKNLEYYFSFRLIPRYNIRQVVVAKTVFSILVILQKVVITNWSFTHFFKKTLLQNPVKNLL
jgi:hypothetical protein